MSNGLWDVASEMLGDEITERGEVRVLG